MTIRIAMWSGPRNISTAMMRSFSSRADSAVSDEPFYGAFLKASGQRQPMADDVMASMDCDWQSVATAMRGPAPDGKPVWYQKHMPHHMVGPVDNGDFPDHAHAFLTRDPLLVVASYADKRVDVAPEDLGFRRQVEYHQRVSDRLGHAAPVVDSNAILANPEGMLKSLCAALDITWDPAMLAWETGPHPSDGIWGSHWYNAVWNSTGFGQPTPFRDLPDDARRIADACRADYEALTRYALSPLD